MKELTLNDLFSFESIMAGIRPQNDTMTEEEYLHAGICPMCKREGGIVMEKEVDGDDYTMEVYCIYRDCEYFK